MSDKALVSQDLMIISNAAMAYMKLSEFLANLMTGLPTLSSADEPSVFATVSRSGEVGFVQLGLESMELHVRISCSDPHWVDFQNKMIQQFLQKSLGIV